MSSFGWLFGCLGGRSVWSASRLVWVRFPSAVSRVIPLSAFLLLFRWGRSVGVICAVLPCPVTCGGGGRWLVPVSTLLILRALYLLYTAALRNLTGFLRAKIRLWITSYMGKIKSFLCYYTCYNSNFLIRVWSLPLLCMDDNKLQWWGVPWSVPWSVLHSL